MSIDGREDFVRRLMVLGAQLDPAGRMDQPIAVMASELQLSPAHVAGIREQVQAWTQTGGQA